MVERLVCPFHADEDYVGVPVGDEAGTLAFECPLTTRHPGGGPWRWALVPEPFELAGLSGVAKEFGLDFALPKIVSNFEHRWVEYGVIEQAYAEAHPDDFERLVDRYRHRHCEGVGRLNYSVSIFLAATLSSLSRAGSVALQFGKATAPWTHLEVVSFWATPPAGDWTERLTCESADVTFDYVPCNST